MKHSTKIKKTRQRGFTLIELIVSMLIFATLIVGMTAISVSTFRTYQKSIAIKNVSENIGYALNLMTKDIRMGNIKKDVGYADGSRKDVLMVTRNTTRETVCYKISGSQLILIEGTSDCSTGTTTNTLVDLGSSMTFDETSGFRSCPSAVTADSSIDPGYYACNEAQELRKGWAEINLNIQNPTMESDSIWVQTIVSSRDYGWEDVTP